MRFPGFVGGPHVDHAKRLNSPNELYGNSICKLVALTFSDELFWNTVEHKTGIPSHQNEQI